MLESLEKLAMGKPLAARDGQQLAEGDDRVTREVTLGLGRRAT
jgi:hypothetical protein